MKKPVRKINIRRFTHGSSGELSLVGSVTRTVTLQRATLMSGHGCCSATIARTTVDTVRLAGRTWRVEIGSNGQLELLVPSQLDVEGLPGFVPAED